jgi:capsular polysaccharide biosynthesis protein
VAALAAVAFLVTGAMASLAVHLRGETYRSTAVLSIDQPAVLQGPSTPGPILKLQTLRAQYAALLSTRALLDPISRRVGRPASELEDDLQAVASKNSLLIVVTANGDDAEDTRLLARTAASELVRYASSTQDDAGVKPRQKVVLSILSPARSSQVVAGSRRTVVTTGLFVGAIAVGLVVALASWVRTEDR